MAEPHMKTAGVPKYIRHQDDVPTNAITPTPDVAAEFKQLKMRRKYRFVLFKIDGAQMVVDATGPPSAGFADFLHALPDSDCRYAVYDHEFLTSDGRKSSKLFFVTWCALSMGLSVLHYFILTIVCYARIPQNSNPQFKMAYTHAKSTIRAVCDGALDVNANTKKEIEQSMGVTSGDASDSGSDFEDD
ncbi:Actin depolymerizing factor, partial [Globisporangium splendens]